MTKKRRGFSRKSAHRPYRKLFVISVEGKKTEYQYFIFLNNTQSMVQVKPLKKGNDSSPQDVLERMRTYLKKEKLRPSDEAWLVVDRDQWEEADLNELHKWSEEEKNYGFALSNPNFEYWLLLHFEQGNKISSPQSCNNRIKKYLPDYDKGISVNKFSLELVTKAIQNAEIRDNPPCKKWPCNPGVTTVYKLVKKILNK